MILQRNSDLTPLIQETIKKAKKNLNTVSMGKESPTEDTWWNISLISSLEALVKNFLMALRVLSHKYNPHRRTFLVDGAAPGWGCSFFCFQTII
jgi:hypothetical protein